MATLTLSQAFDGIWLPDALAGGIITLRQGNRMIYTSDAGFTVTLRGNGLAYDSDGLPSGGTLTGFTVSKNGLAFANLIGASVDFARTGMQLFGHGDQNGGYTGPDPYNFLQNALRNADHMIGSAYDDAFLGTIGNDTICAGAGFDDVGAEEGADVMDGGDGWDTLHFDTANYSWSAFRGVDLDAAAGTAIDCWGHTDIISNFEFYKDSSYSDTLRGADVDEYFLVNRGNDLIDGRGGFDVINYEEADRWGAGQGVTINLATGIATDSWGGTDTVANIEGVRGTIFDDTMIGDALDNLFLGGRGVDLFDGAGGNDRMAFWNVGDNNDGGTGVIVDLMGLKQVVNDGYGNAETATSIEDVHGSRFNDRITGNGLRNDIYGDDGNDTILGGNGEDFLGGGGGNDLVKGGAGSNDHIDGGADNDTLTGGAGADLFNFFESPDRAGVDHITDFASGVDEIRLAGWFGGFSEPDIIAAQFLSGAGATTATTAAHRLIYNTTTGDLYLDRDGAGGASAVLFAHLDNRAALTIADFGVEF